MKLDNFEKEIKTLKSLINSKIDNQNTNEIKKKQTENLKEKQLKELQERELKELQEREFKEQIRIKKDSNLLFD